MDAIATWSALLDQLECDLAAVEAAGSDADRLHGLLLVGVGQRPADPPMPLPAALEERARAVHARFVEVEARLERLRRELQLDLAGASASVPRYVDADL